MLEISIECVLRRGEEEAQFAKPLIRIYGQPLIVSSAVSNNVDLMIHVTPTVTLVNAGGVKRRVS